MKEVKNKFFNKENWKSLKSNPLTENVISILLIIIITLSVFTTCSALSYFKKNEILLGVSDKFVTTKQYEIKEEIDTSQTYNVFNNNVNESIKIKDTTEVLTSNKNSYPIKEQVLNDEKELFGIGDIGDFIAGYFGFWLGIIGALLTFLAFYIQSIANKDVQKQFKLQQFETQFHKMIDVYLNNKDKFSIMGYKNPKNKEVKITGNTLDEKLSFKNKRILNCLVKEKNIEFIEYITRDHIVFQKLLVELKVIYRVFLEAYKEVAGTNEEGVDSEIRKYVFSEAYSLFFNGLNKYNKEFEKSDCKKEYIKLALKSLKQIRIKHRQDGSKQFSNFYKGKENSKETLWLKVNYEPFKGYLHFLPQYFRNLHSIVNYVVNQNEELGLSKSKKLGYLKILRSTMSEYEFTLLFYNWLSNIGIGWENEQNKFFSEFNMLKNLNPIIYIDPDLKYKCRA